MLPVQLFEAQQRYAPVNGEYPFVERPYMNKPGGVLWTSTWTGEQYGSDWIQWCLDNNYRDNPFDCYLLTPDPAARIYTIDSLADLLALQVNHVRIPDDILEDERTGKIKFDGFWRTRFVDFASVSKVYDAIHLTEEGQWKTRLSMPADLYGWDCESTCWFRGNFTIESVGLKTFEVMEREY